MLSSVLRRVSGAFAFQRTPARVVVFGLHSPDWNAALGPGGPVWRQVAGVGEVVLAACVREVPASVPAGRRSLLLPLMEDHAIACPREGHAGLVPAAGALAQLRHKGAFAAYVRREGLGRFCPPVYGSITEACFPCVVKRCDLNGGHGVEVADNREVLDWLLAHPTYAGQEFVLQGFVPAPAQLVTHAVCVNGRIVHQASFRQSMPEGERVRRWSTAIRSERFVPSRRVLATLQRFLMPLRFSGLCNFDYVLTPQGQVCVFEINPRLGGSLMLPEHEDVLAEILRAWVRHARPLAVEAPDERDRRSTGRGREERAG